MKRYEQGFWSVSVPDRWTIQEEDDGLVAFFEDDTGWAIHISHHWKESEVLDDDLEEFVSDIAESRCVRESVPASRAQGVQVEFTDEENVSWRHILLRSGHAMVYATYNADRDGKQIEERSFQRFVESIQINGEQRAQPDHQ